MNKEYNENRAKVENIFNEVVINSQGELSRIVGVIEGNDDCYVVHKVSKVANDVTVSNIRYISCGEGFIRLKDRVSRKEYENIERMAEIKSIKRENVLITSFPREKR